MFFSWHEITQKKIETVIKPTKNNHLSDNHSTLSSPSASPVVADAIPIIANGNDTERYVMSYEEPNKSKLSDATIL